MSASGEAMSGSGRQDDEGKDSSGRVKSAFALRSERWVRVLAMLRGHVDHGVQPRCRTEKPTHRIFRRRGSRCSVPQRIRTQMQRSTSTRCDEKRVMVQMMNTMLYEHYDFSSLLALSHSKRRADVICNAKSQVVLL